MSLVGSWGNTSPILVQYQSQSHVYTCFIPAKNQSWNQYQVWPYWYILVYQWNHFILIPFVMRKVRQMWGLNKQVNVEKRKIFASLTNIVHLHFYLGLLSLQSLYRLCNSGSSYFSISTDPQTVLWFLPTLELTHSPF
jgi:hypothetical protein